MKDRTLGAPCYKIMGHAAHTAKIEWVILHFDGAMAQGAVLTETLLNSSGADTQVVTCFLERIIFFINF